MRSNLKTASIRILMAASAIALVSRTLSDAAAQPLTYRTGAAGSVEFTMGRWDPMNHPLYAAARFSQILTGWVADVENLDKLEQLVGQAKYSQARGSSVAYDVWARQVGWMEGSTARPIYAVISIERGGTPMLHGPDVSMVGQITVARPALEPEDFLAQMKSSRFASNRGATLQEAREFAKRSDLSAMQRVEGVVGIAAGLPRGDVRVDPDIAALVTGLLAEARSGAKAERDASSNVAGMASSSRAALTILGQARLELESRAREESLRRTRELQLQQAREAEARRREQEQRQLQRAAEAGAAAERAERASRAAALRAQREGSAKEGWWTWVDASGVPHGVYHPGEDEYTSDPNPGGPSDPDPDEGESEDGDD